MKKTLHILLSLILIVTTFSFSPVAFAACPNTYSTTINASETDYLNRNDTATLAPAASMTIEFWAKLTAYRSAGLPSFIVGKDVLGSREYALGMVTRAGGASAQTYAQIAGEDNGGGTAVLYTDTWYHVAFVWETTGNTLKYYLNGTLDRDTTYTNDPPNTATALAIGRRLYGGVGNSENQPFTGLVDDVRIWNVARTADEINTWKNYEIDSATGLVASWHLNNSTTDDSGNSNTLTDVGNTYTTDTPFTTCSFPESPIYNVFIIKDDVTFEGDVVIQR